MHLGPGLWYVKPQILTSVSPTSNSLLKGPPYGLGRHIEAVADEDVRMLLIVS